MNSTEHMLRDEIHNQTKVLFIEVLNNTAKVEKLIQLAHRHFIKKEKFLIQVATIQTAHYIDELLWRTPEESFIPHCIANEKTSSFIAISLSGKNFNQAAHVINLTNEPMTHALEFATVYELLDKTNPDKERLSKDKFAYYETQELFPKQYIDLL